MHISSCRVAFSGTMSCRELSNILDVKVDTKERNNRNEFLNYKVSGFEIYQNILKFIFVLCTSINQLSITTPARAFLFAELDEVSCENRGDSMFSVLRESGPVPAPRRRRFGREDSAHH